MRSPTFSLATTTLPINCLLVDLAPACLCSYYAPSDIQLITLSSNRSLVHRTSQALHPPPSIPLIEYVNGFQLRASVTATARYQVERLSLDQASSLVNYLWCVECHTDWQREHRIPSVKDLKHTLPRTTRKTIVKEVRSEATRHDDMNVEHSQWPIIDIPVAPMFLVTRAPGRLVDRLQPPMNDQRPHMA